jgi:hypothetical protein
MPEFTKCIFKVSFERTSSSAALNWSFSEKIKEHKKITGKTIASTSMRIRYSLVLMTVRRFPEWYLKILEIK